MASDYASRLGGARSSLAFKAPVRAATTTNITLYGEQTIDGVAVVVNGATGEPDRVLVKNQGLAYENGIYEVRHTAWVRAKDCDGARDIVTGSRVYVHSGTVNAGIMWQVTSADPITIGSSTMTWEAAGDTDSEYITFLQAGTGAVQRTLRSKARDIVSVKDFGATGVVSGNDTAAIQAAVDYVGISGGLLYFPPGIYTISDTIEATGNSVRLFGASRFATLFRQTVLNIPCVTLSGLFNGIDGLSFIYVGGTPTSGATAISTSNSYARITDFVVRNSHTAVDVTTANSVGTKVTDFEILDYESIGIKVGGPNDVFISRFIMNAGNSTRGALGGIRLVDRAEAVNVTDGDILQGVYSLTTSASVDAIGLRPAYNKFLHTYFDSGTTGCSIANLYVTTFTGCWFSGGRSGGGSPGMTLNSGSLNRFDGCEFVNCGSHGALVNSGATKTTFDDCLFVGNSVTTGSGVSHGLAIANSTAEVTINGGMATNAIFAGVQGNGVFLGSSTTDIVIDGMNVKGNNSAGIGGDLSGAIISDCPGFKNRARGSVAVTFGTNGNGTVAHTLASTPTWANAVLLGDTNLQVDVESLGSTNLVLRLRDASGADVTSGSPTVMWEAEF